MKIALFAALLGSTALIGTAYAQQSEPAPLEPAAPTETAQPPATEAAPQEGQQAEMNGQAQDQGGFLTWQDQEQMIASNLMGADIWGAGNESIGSVDDLLLDREGRVVAVIVGVGGFLGLGEKDVAISADQLEFVLAQDMQNAGAAPGAAAPAGAPAQDPAMAPAQGAPADGAVAPAPGAAAPGQPAPAAPGAAPAGGAPGTPTAPGAAAPGTYGWGWTGAGIDHIQVSFTREQLEAAPEFRAAE